MDRDRLKDIQTADLSEGQVNEEFVQWLKTKGPSYLLIIMIVIVAYMFLVKYQQGKVAHRAEAWVAYIEASGAGLPASHEDVAQTYSEIDSLQSLGLLSAADGYMSSVLSGQTIGSNSNITTLLSAEDRVFYLEKADALYARVVTLDDSAPQTTIFAVSALNGRAAVAESSGNVDDARGYYEEVITRSQNTYPALAVQAQSRIDTLDVLAEEVLLPTDAEVTARNNQVLEREPTPINTSIDALAVPVVTGQ